jgi:hypothetical protein
VDHIKNSYTQLILFSLCLGLFLFFQDENLALYFDGNTAYSDFSANIFKINTSYFAESILLPLAANVLGASSSLHAYKIFCAAIIIMMLPVLSIAAFRYFNSVSIALALILSLAIIFPWFRAAGLGQPDPLTIFLLILAVLQKNPHMMFWCLLGASLSHFSLVLMALPAVIAFLLTTDLLPIVKKIHFVRLAILALVVGKVCLSLWYFIFSYELGTRLDWIIERWPDFFISRYQSDPMAFWLTPHLYFLIIYFFIAGSFLLSKRYAFVISMLLSLSCAYVANFITIDGYRIVAVILAAPITFVLREILSNNASRIEEIFRLIHSAFVELMNFILLKWAEVISAVVIVFCWIYILQAASVRGLLLNQYSLSTPALGDIEPLFLVLALGALSNMAVIIFDRLRFSALIIISQLVLFLPLGLIALQYFRQVFFYNQPLDIAGKVVAVIYLLSLAFCSIRFKIILPMSFKAAVQLRRLFRGSH